MVGILGLTLLGCARVYVHKNVPEYPPIAGEPIYGPDTLFVGGDTLFVYSHF